MDKNEQTFSKLVREQKSTIYTVCYMFSQNQDEVNDLFQEVLVNLWRGFEGFEGRSDVRTWVYRVALNTCISLDRKRRSRPTLSLTMDIYIDLTSIEVFIDDGLYSYSMERKRAISTPRNPAAKGLEFWGADINVTDIQLDAVESCW